MAYNPIVILHGWNLSGKTFQPLVHEFKKRGYTVYCPDLPGFGITPIPDKPFRLSNYVAFVKDFLEKEKISKVILIGHSFGGRISIKFAAENQDRLKALILTGAPAYPPVPRLKIIFFLSLAKTGNLIFSLPILNIFKFKARNLLYKAAKAKDFKNAKGVMRDTFKNIIAENLIPYLSKINAPTLLLWGKDDQIAPVALAYKANKTLKISKLTIIPEARHAVPWTHPKIFAAHVIDFIKEYV